MEGTWNGFNSKADKNEGTLVPGLLYQDQK